MAEKQVGVVAHFYGGISVAVVDITDTLKVGDEVRFKGATTDFTVKVDSMQIEHKDVEEAKKGQSIGMKVPEKVRDKDIVLKVAE